MGMILRPFAVFVQHPGRILLVAAIFLVIGLLIWNSRGRGTTRRDLALMIPAAAWGLYAVWERALTRFSPEANIRVDLLVISPLLLAAIIIGTVSAVRGSPR